LAADQTIRVVALGVVWRGVAWRPGKHLGTVTADVTISAAAAAASPALTTPFTTSTQLSLMSQTTDASHQGDIVRPPDDGCICFTAVLFNIRLLVSQPAQRTLPPKV